LRPNCQPTRLFHAIRLVRGELRARGLGKVLLLGTRFTMEDGYYVQPLRDAGIRVETPAEIDRAKVGEIQTRLADGVIEPDFAAYFRDLISRHALTGCEAVVLGCTELPLLVTPDQSDLPLIDPLVLQCRACVDFALA
jgi:aspartate racemase